MPVSLCQEVHLGLFNIAGQEDMQAVPLLYQWGRHTTYGQRSIQCPTNLFSMCHQNPTL